jgi:translation elongation factor EF-Tu-like GTPase
MKTDFIAVLKYRTTDEGGRTTRAASGIRPVIKFPFAEMMTSGQQKFIDKEWVYPGETVRAEITLLATDYFKGTLYDGLEFEFKEGSRVIGTGRITKILNESLRATR